MRKFNLLSEELGTEITEVSDEFFGEAKKLILDTTPIDGNGRQTEVGRWVDGWMTRRHHHEDYQFCSFQLKNPAKFSSFEIDTTHLEAETPKSVQVFGKRLDQWVPISWEVSEIKHGVTEISCEKNEEFSEIKLHIKPDGAIARFRAFGQYQMMTPPEDELIDMVSIFNAPEITEVTNELVSPAEYLFFPGRGTGGKNGWVTSRDHEHKKQWVIIKFAKPAIIEEIEIDTYQYKGDYPEFASIDYMTGRDHWHPLISKTELIGDKNHTFNEFTHQKATGLKLTIYPDGAISRLRVWGRCSF